MKAEERVMGRKSNAKVYVFWDNSNIFIEGQRYCSKVESTTVALDLRIEILNLFKLAVADREIAEAVCVGSVPPELEDIWKRLEAAGIHVERFERGKGSGKEQGVDQCLQVHMLRALVDATEPGIVVLLTGDGKGFEDGIGFHADLERMYKKGWGIEVLSWTHSCSGKLKTWSDEVGVFLPLENWYKQITFTKKLRSSKTLDLTKRKKAVLY
ncbi:MAG: NYN domain-containing protein [Acidobacteriaceae bacterium]|nr:NYN domain-containing protein [Acidobacteriaceae bacterium]